MSTALVPLSLAALDTGVTDTDCSSLLATQSRRLPGDCSRGAGLVVALPGQGSLPVCGREPLLSTLESWSGTGRALSSLPPSRLAAMWQGGPPALGGPPRQTHSRVRAATQGARPLPCKVSELESGNRCRNVVYFRTNATGCSPGCWSPGPLYSPFLWGRFSSEKGIPGGWSRVGWAGTPSCLPRSPESTRWWSSLSCQNG